MKVIKLMHFLGNKKGADSMCFLHLLNILR